MRRFIFRAFALCILLTLVISTSMAQLNEMVNLVKSKNENKLDVFIGQKLFTCFICPDSLEKPVLYPIYTADGTTVTRGFPLDLRPGEPTDHPHHVGLWLTFENVNGLDFWNNSYAIPAAKKQAYGWIKTDSFQKISGSTKGALVYYARWHNQQGKTLLEETTRLEFSGSGHHRMIDRLTVLKADTDVLFTDAKDGMLGIRLAHELQMPAKEDQEFKDNKGNSTLVKGGTDTVANGNYLTSEGKQGDAAWGSRAVWCKVYAKMGIDSVSIAIIDHPGNPGYPTFWHARGYGLFAANPLGQRIFTNGKDSLNLHLKKDQSVSFRYRIVIDEDTKTIPAEELNRLAEDFAKSDLQIRE